MVVADADPALRRRRGRRRRRGSPCRPVGSGKSCTSTRTGVALGLPLPALVGQVADHLLLLGVHADHRLARPQVLLGLLVEVAELAVAVGMLGALDLLGGGLQRVAHRHASSFATVLGADRVALRGQLVGQLAGRLAGPPQRRLRIAPGGRLDQRVQGRQQARVALGRLGASRARRGGPARSARDPGRSRRSQAAPSSGLIPDARATAAIPPRPSARACAPASRRRCRSSRCGDSTANIAASASSVTSIPGHYITRVIVS